MIRGSLTLEEVALAHPAGDDVRGRDEVGAERRLGGVGVVRRAGLDDPQVLAAAALERAARVQGGDPVALAVLPERPDEAREPRRPRRLVEAEVEGGMRLAAPAGVTGAVRGDVLLDAAPTLKAI